MSRARELSRLGNPNIISADSSFNVGFGTATPKEKVNVVGVVSATSFFGDGSTLDGIASAGIGTALSDDKTKALNTIYFTNDEVLVTNNSTVNPPDSGHIAYTQAPTVVVDDTKELIISDGDDLLVDVLGIATGTNVDFAARGNGVFDNIYVDNIESSGGQTSVNFPKGLVSTGVATFHSDVSIGGTLTYEDVKNIDSVGLITARTGIKVSAGGIDVAGGGIDVVGDIGLGAGKQTGTAGQLLTSGGAGADASWTSISAAPTAEAVAHGSIGVGTAVAVRSDGKFVAITGTNAETSTAVAVGQANVAMPTLCYDTANNKVVAVWMGYSDDDCYAMVGTISGTSITWGTPVKYDGTTNSRPNAVAYDSTNERIIIVGNQDWGGTISSCVGQVSGTGASGTITFGTKVQVVASGHTYPSVAFDPTTGRVICTYRRNSGGNGFAKIGTISGNTVTWGSETQWDTVGIEKTKVAAGGGYAVAIGSGHGNPARYNVGQISTSGNSITWGTQGSISQITTDTATVAVDPNTNMWAIQGQDPGDSMVKLHPATRSGTSLTFGTVKQIYTGTGPTNNQSLCWAGAENVFFSTFSAGSSASAGQQFVTSTISGDGSAVSQVSNPQVFLVSNGGNDQPDATASTHTTGGKCVIFLQNNANSRNGWAAVEQIRISTGTIGSYVGLSNAAYTNGQTAKVSVTGAVSTNQSGLTAGTRYYLMADGTLNSAADGESILVGNALSSTNILLR